MGGHVSLLPKIRRASEHMWRKVNIILKHSCRLYLVITVTSNETIMCSIITNFFVQSIGGIDNAIIFLTDTDTIVVQLWYTSAHQRRKAWYLVLQVCSQRRSASASKPSHSAVSLNQQTERVGRHKAITKLLGVHFLGKKFCHVAHDAVINTKWFLSVILLGRSFVELQRKQPLI